VRAAHSNKEVTMRRVSIKQRRLRSLQLFKSSTACDALTKLCKTSGGV